MLIVASVRDAALGAFGRPFCCPSTGVAIRSFGDEVNRQDAGNELFKHPEDFELFELGTFDEVAGKFVLLEAPRPLCRGVQMVVKGGA